jgi:phospholipase C
MTEQILDPEAPGADPMSGFVANYVKQKAGVPKGPQPNQRAIMHYFNDCHMPVSRGLARRFAVSDRYFASGPTQTLPNRAFSMCGSPGKNDGKARLNNNDFKNSIDPLPYGSLDLKSIFELLDDEFPDSSNHHHSQNKALNWKVYYHDSSLSMISSYLDSLGDSGPNITNFDTSDYGLKDAASPTFAEDLKNGVLPKLAFIEPRYISNYVAVNVENPPNDNHPGGSQLQYSDPTGPYSAPAVDVMHGEVLLHDVVSKLQKYPETFKKTLLIVTYDEHGGLYDHVLPPPAPTPYKAAPDGFAYTRYGVRVPTLFINPQITPHTVLRPATGSQYPFDHTSIIRTVREQFPKNGKPLPPLTNRDEHAPVISDLFPPGVPVSPLTDAELAAMAPPPMPVGVPVGFLTRFIRRVRMFLWCSAVRFGLREYNFHFGLGRR